MVGVNFLINEQVKFVNKGFFKLLVNRTLHLLAATLEAHIQILKNDNGMVLDHECDNLVYGLRQVTLFQLLDALDGVPALALLLTLGFTIIEQTMIVGDIGVALVFILNLVK